MQLHTTTYDDRLAFLFIDEDEHVVEYLTEFLRSLVRAPRNLADGTLHRYAEKLRDIGSFLEAHKIHGQIPVDDALRILTTPTVAEFYRDLQAAGLRPATVRLAEAAVRRFTNWMNTDEANYAHSEPLFPPGSPWQTPPETKRQPRYLTHSQLILLLKALRYEAQRLVVHFVYDTGVRVSEVPRLLASDLPDWHHYPEGQMYFPLLIRGSKSRNREPKERTTIISRPMLSRIAKHHNTKNYRLNSDFSRADRPAILNVFGEQWTDDAIQALMLKAGKKTGMPEATPHRLRHGTAYSVLKSEHGASLMDNLVILQKMFGHNNVETTENFYTNIPAALLQRLNKDYGNKEFATRYEEAQVLFDATFLLDKKQPPIRRIGRTL